MKRSTGAGETPGNLNQVTLGRRLEGKAGMRDGNLESTRNFSANAGKLGMFGWRLSAVGQTPITWPRNGELV